jgi:beta-glucosidase/6-phospho-beta-glucosidase/beta-galactosidase
MFLGSHLLERKLALALGANAAGFIQWIWNTNCYMASGNEASFGLILV